ncbi:MAG: hypothetical protein RSE41_10920 [Clostridia bacterium]
MYRKISVLAGILATLGSFLISYLTLHQYNMEFVFIFTFIGFIISLFGVLLVFVQTNDDIK